MKLRTLFIVGLWLISTLCSHGQTVEQRQPPPSAKDVADLAGNIVGGQFHKWTAPPRLSLMGDATKYHPVVEKFVTELNTILAGLPSQLVLVGDNLKSAEITFYLGSNTQLADYRRAEHARANYDYWETLNPDKSIKHYAVFMDSRFIAYPPTAPPPSENIRAQFSTFLLKSYGFYQTHAPLGTMVSVWDKFLTGPPEETGIGGLWLGDKKLIRFAYDNFPNGASVSDVKQIVLRQWQVMQAPAAAPAPVAPIAVQPPPVAPVAPVVVNPPLPANKQEQLEQFIVAALTTNECGTFRKWLDSPRFSCLYEMTQCRDVVDAFCHEVSDALQGLPIQPKLGPDNDKNAHVTVIVLRLEEGDVKAWEIARNNPLYGRDKVMKTPGYVSNSPILAKQTRLQHYQIQPQQGARIENGQFVHLPVGEDNSLKNQIFRYGLWSFGLSPVPGSDMDSMLSPYNPQHPRDPRHLTTFDKKLLRFAYQYVPVGASKDEIRGLIMLHWDKMQMPAAASTPAAPVAPVAVNPPVTVSKEGTASTPEIAAWWANKVNSSPNIGFHKWNKTFRLSLYGQAVQARSIATKFIEDVRPILSGVQPVLVEDNSPNAEVHFIMENKQGQGRPADRPDYHVSLNKDQSISHLDIFIDSSVYIGGQPEVVRAQIYQSFLRSLVHVSNDPSPSEVIGETGRYTHGEIDKELISFIYANIPNGASSSAIKEIFHKWNPVAPVAPVANDRATFTGSYDALGMTTVNGTQVLNFLSKGVVGKSIRVFSGAGQPIEGYDGGKKCLVVFSPNKKDGTILLTLTYE